MILLDISAFGVKKRTDRKKQFTERIPGCRYRSPKESPLQTQISHLFQELATNASAGCHALQFESYVHYTSNINGLHTSNFGLENIWGAANGGLRELQLVFITSVPPRGFRRSSRRPSRRTIFLSEALGLVAPHCVAPWSFSKC